MGRLPPRRRRSVSQRDNQMTMLEKIARAVHEAQWGEGNMSVTERAEAMAMARAAVEAMLAPSEAMISAYVEAARRPHTATSGSGVTICYQAMLRAILDERPGTTKGPDREADRAG